jgi:hypothetical protein
MLQRYLTAELFMRRVYWFAFDQIMRFQRINRATGASSWGKLACPSANNQSRRMPGRREDLTGGFAPSALQELSFDWPEAQILQPPRLREAGVAPVVD